MIKAYLASPYSHSVRAIRSARFRACNRAAGWLMKKGYAVFSPISHSHPIGDTLDNGLDLDFWLKQDFVFLDWCDIMIILCIDGWQESRGVMAEMRYVMGQGKKVKHLFPLPVIGEFFLSDYQD